MSSDLEDGVYWNYLFLFKNHYNEKFICRDSEYKYGDLQQYLCTIWNFLNDKQLIQIRAYKYSPSFSLSESLFHVFSFIFRISSPASQLMDVVLST